VGVSRRSQELQELQAKLRQRREREAEELAAEAWARAAALRRTKEAAATKLQAIARGQKVRRRLAEVKEAAKYNDLNDSFDFDEVDLDFIRPPEGMELEPYNDAITPSMLDSWPTNLPSGTLAETADQEGSQTRQDPTLHASPLAVQDSQLGAEASQGYDYSQALLRRQLSSSGGALVPTLQRQTVGVFNVPEGMNSSTREWVETQAPELSPTKSAADASSIMSYGSSMKDDERRAKLKAKMDKVAGEWGFENPATAEAFYKAQQKRMKAQKKKKFSQKYSDPQARLNKLKSQVDGRPQLHPSQFQREHSHGVALRPLRAEVEGPPSQDGPRKPPIPGAYVPSALKGEASRHSIDAPYPPAPRRAHSEGSGQRLVGNADLELPPIHGRTSDGERPTSSGSSDRMLLEFRTGAPNRKLVRRVNAALGQSPRAARLQSVYQHATSHARPAWESEDDSALLSSGITGNAIAGHAVKGASTNKPRLQAGGNQPIGFMQMLSPT